MNAGAKETEAFGSRAAVETKRLNLT